MAAGPADGAPASARQRQAGTVLETERLVLREMSIDDADFILALLNEPSFLRYIGDKEVRTVEDARRYIQSGPMESYRRLGFGLYLVELKQSAVAAGICGMLKREQLDDADVGFAFLPRYWSRGYGFESAAAVMDYGRATLGLRRIVAITSPDNDRSIRLLEKLGMKRQRTMTLVAGEPEVELFASEA